jgi:hypothetical protein
MAHAVNQEGEDWFTRVWEYREEVLYPSLLGSESRGIFPISGQMLTETFKQESLDFALAALRSIRVCPHSPPGFVAVCHVRNEQ